MMGKDTTVPRAGAWGLFRVATWPGARGEARSKLVAPVPPACPCFGEGRLWAEEWGGRYTHTHTHTHTLIYVAPLLPSQPRGSYSSALRGPWRSSSPDSGVGGTGGGGGRLPERQAGRCEAVASPPWPLWEKQPVLEHTGRPVVPALRPGLSASLRFSSGRPAHIVGVWLLQSGWGPGPRPQAPAVPPATTGPPPQHGPFPRSPAKQRLAPLAFGQEADGQAGPGQQAPGSIRRTPRSEASMKYSCSKWCNFVCIQPTSCIFQSIMK